MPAATGKNHSSGSGGGASRTKLFTADAIDRRVAGRLSARRRSLGLSPALLDMILGLRDGTIERLESCESRIGPSHLFHLAQVFEVTIDWFFAEPDMPPPEGEDEHRDAEVGEARRFLSFFSRLSNPSVSRHVHEVVKAIAASDTHASDVRPGEARPKDTVPKTPGSPMGTPLQRGRPQ